MAPGASEINWGYALNLRRYASNKEQPLALLLFKSQNPTPPAPAQARGLTLSFGFCSKESG
jgi:hypothetical protein